MPWNDRLGSCNCDGEAKKEPSSLGRCSITWNLLYERCDDPRESGTRAQGSPTMAQPPQKLVKASASLLWHDTAQYRTLTAVQIKLAHYEQSDRCFMDYMSVRGNEYEIHMQQMTGICIES